MTVAEFEAIVRFIRARTGVSISHAKKPLVESHVSELMRTHGIDSCAALLRKLNAGDTLIATVLIDALMTNETLFFRDTRPFEEFRTIMLPHLLATRPKGVPIRIWSAAAASGQEAYSLAILVHELAAVIGPRPVEIFGSDVSAAMVERARKAVYSSFEVQRGLSSMRMIRHFEPAGLNWKLKRDIADTVRFETVNLIEDFGRLPHFDVIFCRNVMLYFDNDTRRPLIERLAAHLRPDGFLVLGGAESVFHLSPLFRPYAPDAVSCVKTATTSRHKLSA